MMTGERGTAKPPRSVPMEQQLQEQLQLASCVSPLLPRKVSQKTGVPKDAVAASEDYAFSLKIDDIKCHLVRQCCLVKTVAKQVAASMCVVRVKVYEEQVRDQEHCKLFCTYQDFKS